MADFRLGDIVNQLKEAREDLSSWNPLLPPDVAGKIGTRISGPIPRRSDDVIFSSSEIVTMIALLANATLQLTNANAYVARGASRAADEANKQARAQVDKIIELLSAKVAEPGYGNGR